MLKQPLFRRIPIFSQAQRQHSQLIIDTINVWQKKRSMHNAASSSFCKDAKQLKIIPDWQKHLFFRYGRARVSARFGASPKKGSRMSLEITLYLKWGPRAVWSWANSLGK